MSRLVAVPLLLLLMPAAEGARCEDEIELPLLRATTQWSPGVPAGVGTVTEGDLRKRLDDYVRVASKHRLSGLASYYSASLDGLPTANGEVFRNAKLTAAHLTLPLGSWVEITSRATGKKVRCRVNDRGPFVKKFAIDLSRAAARAIGVDRHRDRYVSVRLIALPGEEPLPDDLPQHATCTIEEREE